MICLLCEEEIEDGDEIVDGQTGEAIVRDEEDEWTGEMEYGSGFYTSHEECFQEVEGEISE